MAAEEAVPGSAARWPRARPDAFIPDLAGSLNNLAGFLGALGRREAGAARRPKRRSGITARWPRRGNARRYFDMDLARAASGCSVI